MDVALLITCLTDQFYPQVGVAVTKVLEHHGCRVHFPMGQTCCGQPFYNNGYTDQARELARRTVETFEPYPYIVTPSGSCCAMIRRHFPELLADDPAWAVGMRKLAERTYEFGEFVERVLKVDLSAMKLPRPTSITYHYACHLRDLNITDQQVKMLQRIGNVDFRPMEKADQCCGFGGTFAVKYPAISGAIAEDKARCIGDSGANVTVCNEAGCTMNIAGTCHRHGVETRVIHLAEVMAEAMGMELTAFD